jgi:hypothetical protein
LWRLQDHNRHNLRLSGKDGGQAVSYSLTISGIADGISIAETLDGAVSLLRFWKIRIDAAARVSDGERKIATIVLRSSQDRDAALRILYKAGFDVTEGPAFPAT